MLLNRLKLRLVSLVQTLIAVPVGVRREKLTPFFPLVFFILVLYVYFVASPYQVHILMVAGVYALATLGYQIIFGITGTLSLAQGAFYGIGGYTSGLLALYYGWGFEITLLFALMVPMVMALLIGLPVLHLESHYLALATLGFAQIVLLIAIHWQDVTGGANGLAGIPGLVLFGVTIQNNLIFTVIVWVFVGIGVYFAGRFKNGGFGLALMQIQEDPLVARCLGLSVVRLRLLALIISAGYAGLAGALMVHSQRVVSPEILEFPVMVSVLSMAVVGGRASIAGAVVGALFLSHLPEWLRDFERTYLLWYGVAMLTVICFVPYGIMGLYTQLHRYFFTQRVPVLPRVQSFQSFRKDRKNTENPCIQVTNGIKSFGGIRAMDGLSISVQMGCITGIIGANGSGKTTLINVISGTETLDTGRLHILGQDMTHSGSVKIARAGVVRTFQAMSVPMSWNVLDAIAVARLPGCNTNREMAEAEVIEILEKFDLLPYAYKPVLTLPPGHRQRVAIARAYASNPVILLLDEPTIGLTHTEQKFLQKLLYESVKTPMAVVVIEHNIDFLRDITERLICIHHGKILAQGSFQHITRNEKVVSAYFGQYSKL